MKSEDADVLLLSAAQVKAYLSCILVTRLWGRAVAVLIKETRSQQCKTEPFSGGFFPARRACTGVRAVAPEVAIATL